MNFGIANSTDGTTRTDGCCGYCSEIDAQNVSNAFAAVDASMSDDPQQVQQSRVLMAEVTVNGAPMPNGHYASCAQGQLHFRSSQVNALLSDETLDSPALRAALRARTNAWLAMRGFRHANTPTNTRFAPAHTPRPHKET
jgi:hypothetical protein